MKKPTPTTWCPKCESHMTRRTIAEPSGSFIAEYACTSCTWRLRTILSVNGKLGLAGENLSRFEREYIGHTVAADDAKA